MFYTIIADSKKFRLSEHTIKRHDSSILFKVIFESCVNPYVYFDSSCSTVYVDMNELSTEIIINYLRNYPVVLSDITDKTLIEKIHRDATILGLTEFANELHDYLPVINEKLSSTVVNQSIQALRIMFNAYNKLYDPFGTYTDKKNLDCNKEIDDIFNSNEGNRLIESIIDKYTRTNNLSSETSLIFLIVLSICKHFIPHNLLKDKIPYNNLFKRKKYSNIHNNKINDTSTNAINTSTNAINTSTNAINTSININNISNADAISANTTNADTNTDTNTDTDTDTDDTDTDTDTDSDADSNIHSNSENDSAVDSTVDSDMDSAMDSDINSAMNSTESCNSNNKSELVSELASELMAELKLELEPESKLNIDYKNKIKKHEESLSPITYELGLSSEENIYGNNFNENYDSDSDFDRDDSESAQFNAVGGNQFISNDHSNINDNNEHSNIISNLKLLYNDNPDLRQMIDDTDLQINSYDIKSLIDKLQINSNENIFNAISTNGNTQNIIQKFQNESLFIDSDVNSQNLSNSINSSDSDSSLHSLKSLNSSLSKTSCKSELSNTHSSESNSATFLSHKKHHVSKKAHVDKESRKKNYYTPTLSTDTELENIPTSKHTNIVYVNEYIDIP